MRVGVWDTSTSFVQCQFRYKAGRTEQSGVRPSHIRLSTSPVICHGEVTVRGPSHLLVPTRRTARHFSADDQSDLTVGCSSLGSAFQVLQRACASELLVWNLGASAPLPQSRLMNILIQFGRSLKFGRKFGLQAEQGGQPRMGWRKVPAEAQQSTYAPAT